VVYPGILFRGGGGSTNSVEDTGRENGDLGAVVPKSGVSFNLKMSETRVLIRLLLIFHGTGNSAQLCQNFGIQGGITPLPPPPPGTQLFRISAFWDGRGFPILRRNVEVYIFKGKDESLRPSEPHGTIHPSTLRHMPEGLNPQVNRCEN
jgi:hypothetical protein